MGTFSQTRRGTTCLPGVDECLGFELDCPALAQTASGELDMRRATRPDRGLVMLFSAGKGERWWGESQQDLALLDRLLEDGFTVVQVRWNKRESWLLSAPGEDAGTAHLACRPATVVQWVHDNVYVPQGLDPAPLTCGFCLAGSSGGASQVTYPLAFYGLDGIVDAVVPISGPPHADQAAGCLHPQGQEDVWYAEVVGFSNIDGSYGFRYSDTDGPCARLDAAMAARWQAESVATGGADYDHPATRVHFILGTSDTTGATGQGKLYAARLEAEGSPHVTVELIDMGHGLNDPGRELLRQVLLE